ncbi:MAG: hypothetical protein IPG45_24535 [Deltaproteobacteria bacterium]|jgi:hypothetical protein|nr:hypothetical protein [Deltaproteobacteria bacterium]
MIDLHHFFAVTLLTLTWAAPAPAQAATGPCEVSKDQPPGFITVGAKGAARVYWGKELLGEVPLVRHQMPAGCVELRMESVTSNEVLPFRATVEPGRGATYNVSFPNNVPALSLRPAVVAPDLREGLCKLNPHVDRALKELENLAFAQASKTLRRAIASPDTCREDLISIYSLKGIAEAIGGEDERCQEDFAIVLSLDPKFTMPPTFPKIERCLEAARATPEAQRPLSMSINTASYDRSRAVYTVPVALSDPRQLISRLEVFARPRGATDYWRLSVLRSGDTASIEIPEFVARPGAGPGLEYVVAATDRWGGRLFTMGSRSKPLSASP